jgi:uncharacterized protein (DUF58 family)
MLSFVQSSRFRLIAGVWGASLLFLLFQGGRLAFSLFTGFTAIVIYLFLVSRSGISSAKIERSIPSLTRDRIISGSEVDIHLDFYIPGFMPIPYVLVTEKLKRHNGKEMLFESSFVPDWKRRGNLTITTPPLPRGRYTFEETSCAVEDIFGFSQYRKNFRIPYSFIVYPQTVQIKQWHDFSLMYRGKYLNSVSNFVHRETTQFNGVREYLHGDPLSRIHWNASARTGTWKSKEYEKEALPRMIIALECAAEYASREQFETAVSIAASLMEYGRQNDLPIGLLTNESDTFFAAPQRNKDHYEQILQRLIDVEPNGTLMLEEAVQAKQREFSRSQFLVFITPRVDESVHRLLRWTRMKGFRCSIIQVTATPKPGMLPWQKEILAAGIPSYRIGSLAELPSVLGGRRE